MDEQQARLSYLFNRYKDGTATGAERKLLLELAGDPALEETLKDLVSKVVQQVDAGAVSIDKEQSKIRADEMLQQILRATDEEASVILIKEYPATKVTRAIAWWRYAAAACILLFFTGGYWFFNNNLQKGKEVLNQEVVPTEVMPGKDGAVLILANGTKIILDSANNGKISDAAVKFGNQLSYSPAGNDAPEYNMMTTPKGRQFSLVLADGSRVWLNAASSIRFPTRFTGPERKVEITGEAYFEVAPINSSQGGGEKKIPFIVSVNGMEVEVLGTHFNINAYKDEPLIKTTLLEGSVKVVSPVPSKGVVILKPGQQAQLKVNGELSKLDNADTNEAMAWRNGYFSFRNADLKTIMRQVARWYDVDVVYDGAVPKQRFGGEMSRNSNLSQVLEILKTSGVKFRIEGRKVTIRP